MDEQFRFLKTGPDEIIIAFPAIVDLSLILEIANPILEMADS